MSTSPESRRFRVARVLGVVALLVVQGGCGMVLAGIVQLQRLKPALEALQPPAAKDADLAHTKAMALMFSSAAGAINWFGDDMVVVMTVRNERVHVRVDPDTIYLRLHEDGTAAPADLYPGADIVVSGNPDPDGIIRAEVVLVGKP